MNSKQVLECFIEYSLKVFKFFNNRNNNNNNNNNNNM